jgi:hypothetical protein
MQKFDKETTVVAAAKCFVFAAKMQSAILYTCAANFLALLNLLKGKV